MEINRVAKKGALMLISVWSLIQPENTPQSKKIKKYGDNIVQWNKNGKIYDPGRGRVFKSNLYLLDDGTLKVEGCLISICDHEIWQPLVVTINEDGTRTAEPLK